MRFASIAIAALLSVASAKNNLADQLTSLKSMVQATGEWNTNNMIDVISARKIELEGALQAGTMSKAEVAEELRYLLQLVRDVESNNKAHAVTTLTSRKASLVNLEETTEETTEEGDGDADTFPGQEQYQQAIDAAQESVETTQEAVELAQEVVDDAQEAYDAIKDDEDVDQADKDTAEEALKDANDALDRANTALEVAKTTLTGAE